MKRITTLIIALMLMVIQFGAFAEMGVQVIGGPDVDAEPVSLDDLKLNIEADIPGFCTLVATSYEVVDALGYYREGQITVKDKDDDFYVSGNDADFAILRIDITNTGFTANDFLKDASVTVFFDEDYQYGGWFYQYNYDNYSYHYDWTDHANWHQNTEWVINSKDQFAIGPMYQGHYCFGCTLPNAVLQSKKPLRMVITLGENEITYNIRK